VPAFFVPADFVAKFTIATLEVDPMGETGLSLGAVVSTLRRHVH
jgi:hypothetical protein